MSQLRDIFDRYFPAEFDELAYDLWVQNFVAVEERSERGRLQRRELEQSTSGVVRGRIRQSRIGQFQASEAGQSNIYDAQVKLPIETAYPIRTATDETVEYATEIVDPEGGTRYRVLDYRSDHNTLLALDVRELPGTARPGARDPTEEEETETETQTDPESDSNE